MLMLIPPDPTALGPKPVVRVTEWMMISGWPMKEKGYSKGSWGPPIKRWSHWVEPLVPQPAVTAQPTHLIFSRYNDIGQPNAVGILIPQLASIASPPDNIGILRYLLTRCTRNTAPSADPMPSGYCIVGPDYPPTQCPRDTASSASPGGWDALRSRTSCLSASTTQRRPATSASRADILASLVGPEGEAGLGTVGGVRADALGTREGTSTALGGCCTTIELDVMAGSGSGPSRNLRGTDWDQAWVFFAGAGLSSGSGASVAPGSGRARSWCLRPPSPLWGRLGLRMGPLPPFHELALLLALVAGHACP
ncbi:hypothetical protein HYDPIDRAFT_167507 [Hydnomerulius pinastri MD-312]|uniref:Uncharacterized protein n=1 Tax=Hydnomerulius pinastri MD-312 TaxID=994086 RepID=A0A0C9VHY4_9AGAM|nr:hypothetical protein HYDPIDRAFT_167507 [Hydnomerulius pinastri MD-312]